MSTLIPLIESHAPFNQLGDGIHGKAHARRVLLFSQFLCSLIQAGSIAEPDETLLLIAAMLHDCGRRDDGPDPLHADRSAEMALNFCDAQGIRCNRDLLAETIRFHCKSGNYHWETPSLEARILADADKLDRFRFHSIDHPLDQTQLHLSISHLLIPLAADVNRHPQSR